MAIRITHLWLVAFSVIGSAAWAQSDVEDGRRVARSICSACHIVEAGQNAPKLTPPAPSFQSIAQRPSVSGESIQAYMTMTHRGARKPNAMPDFLLSHTDARRVADYILSLRGGLQGQ